MQHLLIIRTFASAKGYYLVLPRDGLLPLRGFCVRTHNDNDNKKPINIEFF